MAREDFIRVATGGSTRRSQVTSEAWVEALLLAARHLGVSSSPESVRSASAWAAGVQGEQGIIDIALSSGLAAQFVEVELHKLSQVMLPALLPLDGSVGVLTAIADGKAKILLGVEGQTVERAVPLEELGPGGRRRILVVREREVVRESRLDAYLAQRPNSWLRGIFVSHWGTIAELGLGSLVGNLMAVATSLFAMQVWDRVVPARSTHTLWILASGVALALLLELLIRVARVSIADHFGKRADLKLSAMFFARTLDIRNDARPRSPGTLVAQLRDLEQLRELLTSSTLGVLIDLPFVFAFLAIIWALGGPLVYVPLAAIPLLVLPGVLAQVPLARLANEGLSETAVRNAVLMESIYRAEDIKVLQAEPRFRAVWNKVNRVSADIGLRQRYLAGALVNFSQMVQQLAYVAVLVAGVYEILEGRLSFGAVLACSILTSRTIAPLSQIAAVLSRLQNARVGKKGLDSLLKLPVDHDPNADSYHKPVLVGRYRFENVAYAYGPGEKPALVVPSLKVEPGERIAVLGRVGAGKSTLLRLTGGLATPTHGRILFNDTNMGLIDVADVRRDTGLLLQESSLFYGSVRENMLIANPRASDEQILEAMRISCADQLVLNQPHGLDLMLREGGAGLSGGQKQCLMLARVVLRSPNIVILDEPTAALDEATEANVIEHLRAWLGQRTLIVATHRYPVLALVDRILVVDQGRIVQDKPRDEILSTSTGRTARRLDGRDEERPSSRSMAE